jgi:hypothetical protein
MLPDAERDTLLNTLFDATDWAKAGIPAIGYDLLLLGQQRTDQHGATEVGLFAEIPRRPTRPEPHTHTPDQHYPGQEGALDRHDAVVRQRFHDPQVSALPLAFLLPADRSPPRMW